jgi:NAD(P)-dependent dehydrogenase (short-subunit alcohol dehydrogenase family)
MNGLKGKAYIVAGGATGIGAGAAERLGAEGTLVTVGDVAIGKARAIAERIAAAGGRAIAVEFDLADEASVDKLVSAAIAEFGRLDGLFNVGADLRASNDGRDLDLLTTDLDVWQRTFDVNLLGYVRIPHS